ncbi:Uncharacterised protein [Pseudomonas aeruginosa]|nr:Uncharacterised protein [Pseudomonas aeruginosa]
MALTQEQKKTVQIYRSPPETGIDRSRERLDRRRSRRTRARTQRSRTDQGETGAGRARRSPRPARRTLRAVAQRPGAKASARWRWSIGRTRSRTRISRTSAVSPASDVPSNQGRETSRPGSDVFLVPPRYRLQHQQQATHRHRQVVEQQPAHRLGRQPTHQEVHQAEQRDGEQQLTAKVSPKGSSARGSTPTPAPAAPHRIRRSRSAAASTPRLRFPPAAAPVRSWPTQAGPRTAATRGRRPRTSGPAAN